MFNLDCVLEKEYVFFPKSIFCLLDFIYVHMRDNYLLVYWKLVANLVNYFDKLVLIFVRSRLRAVVCCFFLDVLVVIKTKDGQKNVCYVKKTGSR